MKEGEVGILSSTFGQWANHQPFTRALSVLVNQILLLSSNSADYSSCNWLAKNLPFQHIFITFWYAHDFQSHKPAVCILKKAEQTMTVRSILSRDPPRRTGNAVAGYFWLVGCPKTGDKTPKMSILQPTEVETSKSKMASKSLDIHFWHALKKGDYDRFHHRLGVDSTNSKVNDPRLLQQLGRPFGCRGCRRLRCCVAVCRGATRAVTVCP